MRKLLRTLREKIDPHHTVLVVVDMQNDFCSPDGSFSKIMGCDVSPLAAIAPDIAEMARIAKEAGVFTIYTQVTTKDMTTISDAFYEVNLTFYEKLMGDKAKDDGTAPWASAGWGEDFFPPIKPDKNDVIVIKHRFGAFPNTKLDQVLRSNNIRTLVFTGVLTDVCVESTARTAVDLDYYVVVVSDCTATASDDRQQASLAIMSNIIGQVCNQADIYKIWQNKV